MKLYGVSTQQGPIFIVQELMVNGKVSSVIQTHFPLLKNLLLPLPPFPTLLPLSNIVFCFLCLFVCLLLFRLSATVSEAEERAGREDRNHPGHGTAGWRCYGIPGAERLHSQRLGT